jgi:transcription antitermination factor NusB
MDEIIKKDPRHVARVLAVQYLFTKQTIEITGLDLDVFESNALLHLDETKKFNTDLYEQIIEGVESNVKEIDKMISEAAPAWPLDQVNPVDLIILRCAVWEGKFYKETPVKVVINEAIEIAKVLSSAQSSKFINGVLGNLLV